MSIDFTDFFCGAGGSSIGLAAAGLELKLAANHWARAIETHAANFRAADHIVADVSNYDMRRLPRTQVLWASPECTWHSPAGGRRRLRAQLDMFDEYVPTDAAVRSRATAFDVIRAAEVHRYQVIIVENVVEFADWQMFDWWLDGLRNLGYTCQLISVSSAHVGDTGNLPAPQWRDRLYIYCTAKGVPIPDVHPHPAAWCPTCDTVVAAVQSWRHPGRRIGKYGRQYDYRCPNRLCRHRIVEPYALPASSIIDWADPGTRIGDRPRPLAPATMRRIQAGLELFTHPTVDLDTPRTTLRADEPVYPPLPLPGPGGGQQQATRDHAAPRAGGGIPPIATASTRHHAVTAPPTPPGAFIQKHHGGLDYPAIGHMTKPVTDPLPTVVSRGNLSLVIPYRRARTRTTRDPLPTQATVESVGLATLATDINDCYFRMLKPRESARAQRFPDSYQITGNSGEQQMQVGNAVSSNVAQWLGAITMEVLA